MAKSYPIFVNLATEAVLVVGGGMVAERKIRDLLATGARVFLVTKTKTEKLTAWIREGKITDRGSNFREDLLENIFLVIAATDDEFLNKTVAAAARARQKLVNVVDIPALCNFTLPAVIERLPVQIAVGTGGTSPVLARKIKEKLELIFPVSLGKAAQRLGDLRVKIKALITDPLQRRKFWEELIADSYWHSLAVNDKPELARRYAEQRAQDWQPPVGLVSLVGAGPGDRGLITIKGFQAVQNADVVLYDALIAPEILSLVRKEATLIDVGKRAGSRHTAQAKINELLITRARGGEHVVRLKSGDPFIFGRGGEEAAALKEAGIAYEVIPGITAALGAAAGGGIPLTHRDHAQTVIFITGNLADQQQTLAWDLLARPNQTLAVYMGVLQAAKIAAELIKHGRAPSTPAAVISHGTWPDQKTTVGTLNTLPALAAAAVSPALIVVGETAGLGAQLKWQGELPSILPWRQHKENKPAAGVENTL